MMWGSYRWMQYRLVAAREQLMVDDSGQGVAYCGAS